MIQRYKHQAEDETMELVWSTYSLSENGESMSESPNTNDELMRQAKLRLNSAIAVNNSVHGQ
jgi:hypothetical protein